VLHFILFSLHLLVCKKWLLINFSTTLIYSTFQVSNNERQEDQHQDGNMLRRISERMWEEIKEEL
jgi:hypothetical protein